MMKTKKCPSCDGSGAVFEGDRIVSCTRCGPGGRVERGVHEQMPNDQRKALGVGGAVAVGFAAGGLPGAVVGGLLGAIVTSEDEDERVSAS
jgi:hypothetical protein